MEFLIVEVSDEELKALSEAIDVMPLSEELRAKLKEAINEAKANAGI